MVHTEFSDTQTWPEMENATGLQGFDIFHGTLNLERPAMGPNSYPNDLAHTEIL
jgi:hypothetical protein